MKLGSLSLKALLPLAFAFSTMAVWADDAADIRQLVRDGKHSEALSRVDRLLSTKPRDPQLRLLKGVVQREAGRVAEATQTFTKLSEEHPELPEPYNNLAVIWAAQGQYDKARVALEKALRTHPSYAAAHDNLTEIYGRLAGQAYSRALQLDTQGDNAPVKLAMLQSLAAPGAPASTPQGTQIAQAPATAAPLTLTPRPAPAAAVPTAAPASTAAPAAKPAPAPIPTAPAPVAKPAADPSQEVERAVHAWAKAWSDRNVAKYLATYDKSFDPPGQQSRPAWEQDRRARILGKSRIAVNLTELQISVKGKNAVAKFRQDYKADALAVSSRKTLELVQSGDHWLIVKESSGG
jgi:tetratricopeptide (TPR) repeat protein